MYLSIYLSLSLSLHIPIYSFVCMYLYMVVYNIHTHDYVDEHMRTSGHGSTGLCHGTPGSLEDMHVRVSIWVFATTQA